MYCYAAMVANILQWWNYTNKRSWEIKQLGLLMAVSQWILIPAKHRPKSLVGKNICHDSVEYMGEKSACIGPTTTSGSLFFVSSEIQSGCAML